MSRDDPASLVRGYIDFFAHLILTTAICVDVSSMDRHDNAFMTLQSSQIVLGPWVVVDQETVSLARVLVLTDGLVVSAVHTQTVFNQIYYKTRVDIRPCLGTHQGGWGAISVSHEWTGM